LGYNIAHLNREEARAEARRASYKKYNDSEKGAARRKRYEDKHPERKEQWSELMRAKARRR
jgi:hypothetical protein